MGSFNGFFNPFMNVGFILWVFNPSVSVTFDPFMGSLNGFFNPFMNVAFDPFMGSVNWILIHS